MEKNFEILPYSDKLSNYFTQLNLAWVKKYFEVEPLDELMLSDPKKYVIDNDGFIFFAMVNGEVAGTFALLKQEGNTYELSKMAVDEEYQGKNIGNKIMIFCIEQAKRLEALKLVLYSNTKLGPAIHLYRKYGFYEIPVGNSGYKRSNIKMELTLK